MRAEERQCVFCPIEVDAKDQRTRGRFRHRSIDQREAQARGLGKTFVEDAKVAEVGPLFVTNNFDKGATKAHG